MNILGLLFLLLGAHSAVSKKTTGDCSAAMDLCFVVDSSRSICYKDPKFKRDVDKTCPNWNRLLSFIHSLVARMDIGENAIRVGLVVFDCEASVRWDMKRYRNREPLMAAIEQLEYTPGQTNTSGGLDVSRMFVFERSRGDRPYAKNVAIIITDGKATDPTSVQPAIGRLHADNVTTYVVGVSEAVDEESLKELASDPKQNGKTYWTVADFDQLDQVLDNVQNQVCDDATSATPPPGSSSFASSLVTRRGSRDSTTPSIEKTSALKAKTYLTTKTAQPKTSTQATASVTTKTPEQKKTKPTTAFTTATTPEPTTTTGTATTTELITTAETTLVTTEEPKCDPSLSSSSQNLTNIVVYEGEPALFLRIDNCQRVQWQLTDSSSSYNITNYDDEVGDSFVNMFSVSGSQLTIFEATITPEGSLPYSSAGLYTLRYLNPNYTTAANLIVLRTGPVCTSDFRNPKNMKLICSVIFGESPVQPNYPVFKWMDSNRKQVRQEQPIPVKIDSYIRRSTSSLPITSRDTETYECQMTFSVAPNEPYTYTELSAPHFRASCSLSRA